MRVSILLIATYIFCCFRIATAPWRYWQLNARYFSVEQRIFSKLLLDELIPERWRLAQSIDSDSLEPTGYPVFLKPEWGRNGEGIHRVDDHAQLLQLRTKLHDHPKRYLMQEAAPGRREFEIFSIDTDQNDNHHDILTVTEAINDSERYPINSKHNRSTRYSDITASFTEQQLVKLGEYVSEVGEFGMCRLSVRANSLDDLAAGEFHIFEINLFSPMPINLLDRDTTWPHRLKFIRESMKALAMATKLHRPVDKPQPILTLMTMYGMRKQRGKNSQPRDIHRQHS